MNERTKELAEQAGLNWRFSPAYEKCLECFAELVAKDAVAKEREACADLVFEMAQLPKYEKIWLPLHHAQSAIRARSKHD